MIAYAVGYLLGMYFISMFPPTAGILAVGVGYAGIISMVLGF